ncbi:hypothetical protein C4D60_Mb01t27200 [Musa balbisiana]|uniref:Uncharacterized protein n=1 Tax=Musa balbisiana TaxID=52838 RepID=A0A4S8JR34_MUSBA|nr:hypothetical protein C4D60_Mb01t27200 [Musa balbisiana]
MGGSLTRLAQVTTIEGCRAVADVTREVLPRKVTELSKERLLSSTSEKGTLDKDNDRTFTPDDLRTIRGEESIHHHVECAKEPETTWTVFFSPRASAMDCSTSKPFMGSFTSSAIPASVVFTEHNQRKSKSHLFSEALHCYLHQATTMTFMAFGLGHRRKESKIPSLSDSSCCSSKAWDGFVTAEIH